MATPETPPPMEAKAPEGEPPRRHRRRRHRHHRPRHARGGSGAKNFVAFLIAGVIALVSGAIVLAVVLVHKHKLANEAAQHNQQTDAGPHVQVVKVETNQGKREIVYPGEVRGIKQASLFAKSNGYIREMRVDKGDQVKMGDVLATVEAPETDQQLAGARSALILRKQEFDRAEELQKKGVMSEEEREQAEANLKAAQADVNRFSALKGYETIRAPFTGVITARYVDAGALIPASTGATAGSPIVDVAQTDTLRILFNVGQDVAPFIKDGDTTQFWSDEQPGKRYEGKVTRTSSALDPRTRTLLVEIDYDNRKDAILPGTFVHVSISVDAPQLPTVPNDAVIVRDGKTVVAVISEDHKASFKPVELGLNDGRNSQITRGLNGGEMVAVNFPLELKSGATVQPKEAKKSPEQANPTPGAQAASGLQPGAPSGEDSKAK